jgi:hypothetical protein
MHARGHAPIRPKVYEEGLRDANHSLIEVRIRKDVHDPHS